MNPYRFLATLFLFSLFLIPPIGYIAAERGGSSIRDLPAGAQANISNVLGRDDPAYHWALDGQTWRAVNGSQSLTTEVDEQGVHVHHGKYSWSLSLREWGFGTDLRTVSTTAAFTSQPNRLEFARGGLTEWYANGPLGMEQGFTLLAPPQKSQPGELTLAFGVAGDLAARVDPDQGGLALLDTEGHAVLRYTGLTATDANGRALRAWMEITPMAPPGPSGSKQGLALHVDDTNARYPVEVDPLFESARLKSSDGAEDDNFGSSVAVSGNTVVVGAPNHNVGSKGQQGEAYVFVKPGTGWSGTLTESARLRASNGASFDLFGSSVAVSGNTVVVGAIGHQVGSNAGQGEAYVFVKPGTGWSGTRTQNAKLLASDGAALDEFGSSVAVSGNTVVVGAIGHQVGSNAGQGEAYIFVKPGTGWSGTHNQQARLRASDGGPHDVFGISVAVSGNTVVVGAPNHQVGSNVQEGEAYVFVKPGTGWSGLLTKSAKLESSDGAAIDNFGSSVAVSGNTVVVGAPGHNVGSNSTQGEAYVFVKPGTGWSGTLTENAKLISSDGAASDLFGYSVAASGNTVVVGAPLHLVGSAGQGEAYIFVKPGTGWSGVITLSTILQASSEGSDHFGSSVAVSGNTEVVGAPNRQVGSNVQQGESYVFAPATPITRRSSRGAIAA